MIFNSGTRARIRAQIARQTDDALFRKLAGGAGKALAIKIAAAGLTFAMLVLMARAMKPETFGRFGFGLSLATYLSVVAGAGLHTAILRWWPEYDGGGDPGRARDVLYWGERVSLAGGFAFGAGLALLVWIGGVGGDTMLAASLFVPAATWAAYVSGALRAQGMIVASLAPRDVLWRGFGVALALGALASGQFLTSTMPLMALAGALALLTLWQSRRLRRLDGGPTLDFRDDLARSFDQPRRGWLATAAPIWAAVALAAGTQHLDVVVVGAALSPEAAGQYFAALSIAALLGLMLMAANLVAAPIISRHYHRNEHATLQRTLRLVALGVGAPTLAVLAGVALFGDFLLGLFGEEFRASYPILLLLASGVALNALFGPTNPLLMMTGRSAALLRILAISYGAGLAFQLISVWWLGVWGVAIGNFATLLLRNLLARRACIRGAGVDPTALCLIAPILNMLKGPQGDAQR